MNEMNSGSQGAVPNARNVVAELGEGLHRVGPQVVELIDQMLQTLVRDDRGGQRRRLILQKIAIVGRRQLELEV